MADYTLTFYEEDDETVYFEVGTAAAHANPYLQVPDAFQESEIDILAGTARIGRTRCRIIDPQTGVDQAERFLTGLLGDAAGYSKLNGRRLVLKHATGEVIQDGICAGPSLTEKFAGFIVDLDDIRARGIDVPAFIRTGTSTVFPRGVFAGYGTLPNGGKLLAATRPALATYRVSGSFAEFELTPTIPGNGLTLPDFALTAKMDRAAAVTTVEVEGGFRRIHRDVEIWWRASSVSDWFVLRELEAAVEGVATPAGYTVRGTKPMFRRHPLVAELKLPSGRKVSAEVAEGIWAGRHGDGQTRPTNGASVQVLVRYVGEATEDYPFHFEGDFGVYVRNLLRGDYSADERGVARDPRLRYDEDLLTDPDGPFGFPIRLRQMEPVDDIREYLEELCAAVVAAPALDELGRIAPVLSDLPDESLTLAEINDDNAQPIPAWEHPIDGAVTQVEVRYARDVAVPAAEDPTMETSAGDGIRSDEQTITVKPQDSDPASTLQAVMGVQTHKIDGFLFRAVAGERGTPAVADLRNEAGFQLARETGVALIDRFAFGGQADRVKVMRSDADMAAVKVGDWLIDGRSWSPNYATGERGRNHLVQVVSIRDLNPAWREMRIVDAAPYANPIGQPTLGDITADTDGVVSVEVDALPAGGEARVDYAVSDTEPVGSSGLWTFLGRTAEVGTLASPPLPAGSIVWIRSRGEQIGRRPSAWTDAETITLGAPARLLSASLTIDDDGEPTVSWLGNAYALGVRIYYAVHTTATVPTLTSFIDADADDLSAVLTGVLVAPGEWLTVQAEPWTGFSSGTVSGTAGDPIQITQYVAVEGTVGPIGPEGPQGPPGEPGDQSQDVIDIVVSGPSSGLYQEKVSIGADVEYAFVHIHDFTASLPSNYLATLLASPVDYIVLSSGETFSIEDPDAGSNVYRVSITVPYIGTTPCGKAIEVVIKAKPDLASIEAAAAAATLAAAGAQATADGKVQTYYATSAPTAEGVGDLWFDTDDGNKLYRWSGAAWVAVQDSGIAAAILAAADAQETADGKVTTFVGASPPTAEGVGDIWIETDDNNEPHRWDGSNWISIRDGRIAEVETDLLGLIGPLGAIIVSDSEPTQRPNGEPLQEGDQWVHTDEPGASFPIPYFYDGADFVKAGADASAVFGTLQAGVVVTGVLDGVTGDFSQLTVKDWLRSDNFVDGTSGYELTDTDAQFNDVTIRGVLDGATGTFKGSVTIDTPLDSSALEFHNNGVLALRAESTGAGVTFTAESESSVSELEISDATIRFETDGALILEGVVTIQMITHNGWELLGLPTSAPGATNRVWRDSGGFLRIT